MAVGKRSRAAHRLAEELTRFVRLTAHSLAH